MRRCKILKNSEAISGVALVFKNRGRIEKGNAQVNTPLVFENRRCIERWKTFPIVRFLSFGIWRGKSPFITPLVFENRRCIGLGWFWAVFDAKSRTAKPDEEIFFHLFATGWNHLSCDVLKRPEIPRVCFNVLMHRIKDRTSPTELNVFTELVLPLLELLSPATTVHLEPSDLAHALSALQMAYDLSGGTSIKE